MTITINPLSPALGAEILGLDLHAPLDAQTVKKIRRVWLDHLVILFRDQKLNQDELVRFTSYFGTPAKRASPKGAQTIGQANLHPNLILISNIRENGVPIGSLPDGEIEFHHDMIFRDVPSAASILYAVETPAYGGDTMFANCYAAYETLTEEVREKLEQRCAYHHYHFNSTHKGDERGTKAFAESIHPVFRTHDETKRKAVYVNRLITDYIVDMPRAESDALLAHVFDHCEREDFLYRHVWQVGDVLMWDNRCSMHARTNFSSVDRRLMWRSTVEGLKKPL